MRHRIILDEKDNVDVNFLVVACLKSLREKKINLESILGVLKVCLSSPLTSEDKEILLHAALMHTQLSVDEIEEHFLVPLKMSPENVQATVDLFLKEVPETYEVKIIIERIGLLLKHADPEKISAGIVNSGFLIKLARWENHKKALEINTYFATHALVSQMPGSLHEACVANNIPLVKMLISQGAQVISLREGKTPLDICLESGFVRQKLAEMLITEYAAGIMQKIPDFLFAMGVDSNAEPIFLGSQFDAADPKAHFPGAILSLEDLFLKMESWRLNIRKPYEPQIQDLERKIETLEGDNTETRETRKKYRSELANILGKINRELETHYTPKLALIIQRLEECILIGQNKEIASQLRKRIRYMLPPLIKTEFYGLRHLIVERFPISIFSTYENMGKSAPDGALEVYQKLFENDLDIRHSNIRIRMDEQIALLNIRLSKLNEFIPIFEPYGAESKIQFNRIFLVISGVFAANVFLTGMGFIFAGTLRGDQTAPPIEHDPISLTGLIMALTGLLVSILPAYAYIKRHSWPKNPNKPEPLSRLKNIHPNFMNFIGSLPTEKFLNSEMHQNEIQTLTELRDITLNNSIGDVLIHLKNLKNLYESHIEALNAGNLSAVDFEYEALMEPDERLLSSHAQDPGESSGWEESADSRLTLIIENNNNDPIYPKASNSASINSEETTSLLEKRL